MAPVSGENTTDGSLSGRRRAIFFALAFLGLAAYGFCLIYFFIAREDNVYLWDGAGSWWSWIDFFDSSFFMTGAIRPQTLDNFPTYKN